MTILLWALGVMAVQLAVAVFISKCISVGSGPRMVETGQDEAMDGFKFSGSGLPHAGAKSNASLSGLLTAVSPHLGEEDSDEDRANESGGLSGTLLAWPDSKAR